MKKATFRFTGELNDFLPPGCKGTAVECTFTGSQSVKHLVESLGVPHTEVVHIQANGQPVDFSYLVKDGDRITVFPISKLKGSGNLNLQPQIEGEPRFILDNHLGRLAVYLRMLGFDSLYRNNYQDEELAQVAVRDQRILLTRDRRLLMRKTITSGYWVREKVPRLQLEEIVQRFDLAGSAALFRRCLRCNSLLKTVSKEAVLPRLEPLTRRYYDEFRVCMNCDQVYWKGSHYERMRQLVDEVLSASQASSG